MKIVLRLFRALFLESGKAFPIKTVFLFRSSPPEVFLRKGVLKICSEFTGEHIMSKCDFNKVALQLYWNCNSAFLIPIPRFPFTEKVKFSRIYKKEKLILVCWYQTTSESRKIDRIITNCSDFELRRRKNWFQIDKLQLKVPKVPIS